MAQEDNKQKPGFPIRGNDDKGSKKPPRFSIYWVYALIAVILLGYQFFNPFNTVDSGSVSPLAFKDTMLAKGDVEKIDLVKNKEIVRIYIYSDSLKKTLLPG
jgi:cell division protease FtsH